jgi:hypothetical protein
MGVDVLDNKSLDFPMSIFDSIGLVEKSAIRKLQQPIADISSRLNEQMDDLVVTTLCAPTLEDFLAIRGKALRSYRRLVVALSNTLRAKVNEVDLPILLEESFEVLESEIPAKAEEYFGEDTAEEIRFSLSTLRSAYRWIPHLMAAPVPPDRKNDDREISHNFFLSSTMAQFHLDALRITLWENYALIPEVVHELLQGLRQSVMTYAYVREALDLRNHLDARYAEKPQMSWDADDETLAKAD